MICTDRLAPCPGCGMAMRFEPSSHESRFYETVIFECTRCSVIASAETVIPELLLNAH
jgi:hypothetical protein